MKKKVLVALLIAFGIHYQVSAEEEVTPRELFEKVSQAVMFLLDNGESGLEAMSERAADNPFIWKDTYVFVLDCDKKMLVAHPNPKLENNPEMWGLEDPDGKLLLPPLCAAAASSPNGGWYDYRWPKKQTKDSKTTATSIGDKETLARKISFTVRVPGTPWSVGAGIYDDSLTVEELDAKISEWMK